VRTLDLLRTTGFRLALLFLTLFAAASLILFGFLYWQTAFYLTSRVDAWLSREQTVWLAARAPAELAQRLNDRAARDPEGQRPFAIFDRDGNRIAGGRVSLPTPLPPMNVPFEFSIDRAGESEPFRGLAGRLPSGAILLVSQDVREMREFRELLLRAMAWGGVMFICVGLVGAVVTGAGALRRIEGIAGAIERIVNGHLAERLPTHGKDGDLDRLVHVVNAMLDDIERLMHEVKGVTDGIAHDLRTPLTHLLAGLERARRRAASADEYAAAVEDAIIETKGILSTFGALLRISQVEDGARRAGFKTVDLATVAADVTEFYEPLAEAKDVSLSLETKGPAEMEGDPNLLFEALGNLVDNAVKFTSAGGRVVVQICRPDGELTVSVADTGPGIPVEERESVLRRFYRAEKNRRTPGSGLGLTLVAAVARLHGLALAIDDANPGCRVTLRQNHGQGKQKVSEHRVGDVSAHSTAQG
jgi:signal transduction histidine kinase